LDRDESLLRSLRSFLGFDIIEDSGIAQALKDAAALLEASGIPRGKLRDRIVTGIVRTCESIARETVHFEKTGYAVRDRKVDKILTSKLTGIPIMILGLFAVFWLTITGANYPSELLSSGLFWVEDRLRDFFVSVSAPAWLTGMLVDGVYRTLAWVVSVMLPPMAIFFPLFTLLEDSGYLPRIAFNLDNLFRKACAHGKQALTM
jgi:ferrous iron transport protein B